MSGWRERLKAVPVLGATLRVVRGWFRPQGREARIDARDDANTTRILRRVLTANSHVADVGANAGTFLARVVRLAPNGRHVAFEPLPHLADALRRAFPHVSVHAAAVAETAGELEFAHVVRCPAFSGLKRRTDLPADEVVETIRVPVVALDVALPPDFPLTLLKIDVEGAELAVLRGAAGTLARCRPWVLFEHGLGGVATYGTTSAEVLAEFDRAGLCVWNLDDWLKGLPPLTADGFEAAVRTGDVWNFLAGPHTAEVRS